MRLTCEGFRQDVLVKLGLRADHAYVLRWLLSFMASGKQDVIERDGKTFYWVRYEKVRKDLPILYIQNDESVRLLFKRLCGDGRADAAEFPLEKINVYERDQKRVYVHFRPEVLEAMESLHAPTSLVTDAPVKAAPTKHEKHRKAPVVKGALDVFNAMTAIETNGKRVFPHAAPRSDHEYTALYGSFQELALAFYEGRALKDVLKLDELAPWFKTKYAYYLKYDKIKEAVKSCKGSWTKTRELLVRATGHYAKWFELNGGEVVDKEKLPRNVNAFLTNRFNQTSMLAVTMLVPPTKMREASAEKRHDAVSKHVREMVLPLWNSKFDGFTFWNKVARMEQWYYANASRLCVKDANAGWWVGSITTFFESYVEWLVDFTHGQPFLKNIGMGNATWEAYVRHVRSEHGIEIEIPSEATT